MPPSAHVAETDHAPIVSVGLAPPQAAAPEPELAQAGPAAPPQGQQDEPRPTTVRPLPVLSVTTPPSSPASAGEEGKTNQPASAVDSGYEPPAADADMGPPEVHPEHETAQTAEEAEAPDEAPTIEIAPPAARSSFDAKARDTARINPDMFGATLPVLPTRSRQVPRKPDSPEPSAPRAISDTLTARMPAFAPESLPRPGTAVSPSGVARPEVPEDSWGRDAPPSARPERSRQQPAEPSSATSGSPPAEQWAAGSPALTGQEQAPADQPWGTSGDEAPPLPGKSPLPNREQQPPAQRASAASQAGHGSVPSEDWPRADWVAANEGAIPESQGAPQRPGTVPKTIAWLVLVVAAFVGGGYFGLTPSGIRLATGIGVVSPRPQPPPTKAVPPAEPAKLEPESSPRAAEPTPPDLEALEKKPAAQRTLEEVRVLGDYWFSQRNEQVSRLGAELRSKPDLLADEETRTLLMKYIEDRATAVQALTMLAETEAPLALDLVYDVWIRSSERTETTRIAEALLYASDVRPHVSPALEVALALRTQPKACDEIRRLADAAREHGDRRSAMLLVKTASRDCDSGEGTVRCRQCLGKKKGRMREVVKIAADREAPYF